MVEKLLEYMKEEEWMVFLYPQELMSDISAIIQEMTVIC